MYTVFAVIFDKFFLSLPVIAWMMLLFGFLFFSKKLSAQKVMIIFAVWYMLLFFEIILTSQISWWEMRLQWIPFGFLEELSTAMDKNIIYFQIILQIVLFIPMGFFIKFFIKNISAIYLVLLSVFISFFAEWIQYIVGMIYKTGRVMDIDDVIFGIVGFWFGVWIFFIYQKCVHSCLKNKKYKMG